MRIHNRLLYICDMTYLYMRHDFFIYVTGLCTHVFVMLCVLHGDSGEALVRFKNRLMHIHDGLVYACDMTCSYMRHNLFVYLP